MAQLMQVTLDLYGPDEPRADGVSKEEADMGAKTMTIGGIDGMLAAVNATIGPQGYELRRQPTGE